MFCPVCSAEYRPGFTHCHSCDVDLVDRLPDPVPIELQDAELAAPVTVFQSPNELEAGLVRSFLEASGIEVFMLRGIQVAVAPSQKEAALEILNEFRGRAGQDPSTGSSSFFGVSADEAIEMEPDSGLPDDLRCSRCGATLEPEMTACSACGTSI